jgi:hypothetical protein
MTKIVNSLFGEMTHSLCPELIQNDGGADEKSNKGELWTMNRELLTGGANPAKPKGAGN